MVGQPVHNYVSLVSGLTKTTRAKAVAGAKSLLAQAGLDDVASDAGERVSKLADEILAASKANRELMRNLIASEVEQVVAKVGFVRAEEVDRLRTEVRTLQETLRDLENRPSTAPADFLVPDLSPPRPSGSGGEATPAAPAEQATARQAAAKNTAAKKAAVAKATSPRKSAKKAPSLAARRTAKKTPGSGAPGPAGTTATEAAPAADHSEPAGE